MTGRIISALSAFALFLAIGQLQVARDFEVGQPVRHLRVRWPEGHVTIISESTSSVQVSSRTWGPEASSAFTSRTEDGILTLEMHCGSPAPCGGNLDIHVPFAVAIDLDLVEGQVSLVGQVDPISAVVSRGSIHAEGLVSGDVVMQVAKGDVDATWTRAPSRVVVTSANGNVHLMLPQDTYSLKGSLQRVRVEEITLDSSSVRSLYVTTLGGEAWVEGFATTAARGGRT